ncbi:unnamed protein product [Brassica oleracea var. botrytis]|uniref:(rape) hypothetical protein n=1 Tax=Brassica napus TaxID=3708 RepID=A0A816IMG8_BRANA|nr:unnamed protein product [Brassica napus]
MEWILMDQNLDGNGLMEESLPHLRYEILSFLPSNNFMKNMVIFSLTSLSASLIHRHHLLKIDQFLHLHLVVSHIPLQMFGTVKSPTQPRATMLGTAISLPHHIPIPHSRHFSSHCLSLGLVSSQSHDSESRAESDNDEAVSGDDLEAGDKPLRKKKRY